MAASEALPTSAKGWHQRIWALTWPVILANITVPLVGAVDVWVMGRLPDPAYIAAVALGATMFSAVYWLFGFLRMGTTGLTAQALGALSTGGKRSEIYSVLIRAVSVASCLGVAMILLQAPLTWLLFDVIFTPVGKLAEMAGSYYQLRIWGAPGFLIYMVALGMLFGLQRMRETLMLSIGLNITNLSLDLLFVLGFGWGVEGVALGTVISEWGAAALGIFLVWRAIAPYRQETPADLWDRTKLMRLLDVSSNLILRTFFVQLPFLTGTVLATGLGDVNLAAHAIMMQLFFFMTYSLDGFAHTAETLAGYCYGAKNRAGLRTTSIYCAGWAAILAVATSLIFLAFGQAMIDGFTVSIEVRNFAYDYLLWLALAPIFCIWAFLFDGIFIGTTHIKEMRNAMVMSALLWALLLWLTFDDWQYHGVWLAMNAFMLFRGLLLLVYYPRIERAAESPAMS